MIGVFTLTLLCLAPASRAQFSNLDDLGQQFAKQLKAHKTRTVGVADFEASSGAIPSQGHYFAQFLTFSLKHYGKKFRVRDQDEFDAALTSAQITSAALASPEVSNLSGSKVLPEIVITGTISRDAENYVFSISARQVADGRVLYSQNTTFRRTSFIDSFSEPFPPNVGQTIYTIDKKSAGISPPDCAACPSPPYNDFARRDKVRGNVIFVAVISPEGNVVSLQARKLIGDGLDERAFDTIKSWRLKPARAADGTPAYVMIPIEVTFRLY